MPCVWGLPKGLELDVKSLGVVTGSCIWVLVTELLSSRKTGSDETYIQPHLLMFKCHNSLTLSFTLAFFLLICHQLVIILTVLLFDSDLSLALFLFFSPNFESLSKFVFHAASFLNCAVYFSLCCWLSSPGFSLN